MNQYEYIILKACECYYNSGNITSAELATFIEVVYSVKYYQEYKDNNSDGE